MTDIHALVRDNVKNLSPYSCARDEYKGKKGVFMDANENPFGSLNRYPDPYQMELKNAIALFKGITSENIFLGNGSDEVIDLCYRIFCNPGNDKALTFTPTYGMYEVSAAVNDIELIKIPLDNDFQIDIERVNPLLSDKKLKLIFICSPNNPTGNCFRHTDIIKIIESFSGVVVIDEAYSDFSEKQSFIDLTNKYSRLIVMQTFSKALGLAAVRVGMAFSNPEIIGYFNKIKPPYNISTVNQKAALKKLEKTEELKKQVETLRKEKLKLAAELVKLKIIEKVFPSDSNFILVRVSDANYVYNKLTDIGIIVRNRNSVALNCIRITVGTVQQNKKLIKALKSITI
jgi:histidinol-phosphate aminotransferase